MAVRISGVNIPESKHAVISLQSIYGIGQARAIHICKICGVNPATKVRDLTEDEVQKLREVTLKYEIEGDLRRKISMDIKRKMDLGTYQGIRHRRGLPVRGQRTKTNSRTRKGRRKKVK